MSSEGMKFDGDKPQWQLLPYKETGEIVEVLTIGAKTYLPNNWKKVDNLKDRYFGALMRHLAAWWEGEGKDPQTNKSHLAHAGCCLLYLMWHENNKEEE
jgi:hypothetical protein